MNKSTLKEVIKIADSLPERFDVSYHPVTISGSDIHLSGLDATDIKNDETEYFIQMPMWLVVNHKRRISRALKSNGIEGARKYISNVIDLN